MLRNGLGSMLLHDAKKANRFVDLFSGSGVVSWFVSQNTECPTIAVDLQNYSAVMAQAVVCRGHVLDSSVLIENWISQAVQERDLDPLWGMALALDRQGITTRQLVTDTRRLCESVSSPGPVWSAYGGHYFSAAQALSFDYLIKCLPSLEPERSACLAALLVAASQCAASPGHTAQPFQPTATASDHLRSAWKRDPEAHCRRSLVDICPRFANSEGQAIVGDAVRISSELDLSSSDLVFVDPPYSDVQYSRFYHVLETIARGHISGAEGIGRYPPRVDRPQSDFSKRSTSHQALSDLLKVLSQADATVILTFPANECSNGLSGASVREVADTMFTVSEHKIVGRFSTLGGNNSRRASRQDSLELVLRLSGGRG
jgi:adenine-specific DNA methylase